MRNFRNVTPLSYQVQDEAGVWVTVDKPEGWDNSQNQYHVHQDGSVLYELTGTDITMRQGLVVVHKQTDPSSQWVIRHNLPQTPFSWQPVVVTADGMKTILPDDVIVLDRGTLKLTFSRPRYGVVRVS